MLSNLASDLFGAVFLIKPTARKQINQILRRNEEEPD